MKGRRICCECGEEFQQVRYGRFDAASASWWCKECSLASKKREIEAAAPFPCCYGRGKHLPQCPRAKP